MSSSADPQPHSPPPGQFATTHWSLVLAAGAGESQAALAELCQAYWLPLYVYLRRRGHSQHDAEDITQGFFSMLLQREDLRGLDPQRGKFRSFLLGSMKHFLANRRERDRALKRGGGRTIVSLDVDKAESHCRLEPAHDHTPERAFERQWALTLLERTLDALRNEAAVAGKLGEFDRLKVYLTGQRQDETYAQLAEELQSSEDAIKQAVSRMRKRYRQQLRREIAQTTNGADEVDDEIRELFAALRPN
ncbi:MAG: sigma-70 family RNA polymerase sigma factor [Pirellulaceae bacterium]